MAKRNGKAIAVYGAGGHTGRFVVKEALRRGLTVVAIGRDASRLPAGVQARVAAIDDAGALDEALQDCGVVINCAGPFLDTAAPVIEAALRAGCGYIDVTAEQASAEAVFERFDARAREAGVAVIPAAGFYGGLADLLASALASDGLVADLAVAIALDHWWPTEGTRKTGERNQVPRVVLQEGQLVRMPTPAAQRDWAFSTEHGAQAVVELPFSEVITIARHLPVRNLRSWLTLSSLQEIRDATTPPPVASDAQGRSAQRFEMVVQAGDGRSAVARGQDIYAVSAPLVVEAAERMLQPSFNRSGALALGEAFNAKDFLNAIKDVELQWG
ncbi:saccharopine dehydrogenase [Pelomonas sp. Root1217]|uniref:saccharopine dehydrogenase NADP-binding domain-containing protein n=1 Tax=Pelomonas sp. Root1217 TaxID=1736430 RepID=UPI00070E6EB9|nr:saccharopine dehydrogenase NADP-binding domain-containing protein [Pelomonas sp. Root1217]KQV47093.1 saccharopine dehydrogenase [Pelomonas sp. Root1217]